MDLRESLRKRAGETVEDYAVYLIWCGLDPKCRKISVLCRIIGEKDHVARYRAEKMKWKDRDLGVREAGESGEAEAVRIYSEQHHDRWNGLPREAWKPYLRVAYPDVEAEKIRRAKEEQKAKDAESNAKKNIVYDEELRAAKFDEILLAAEIRISQRLKANDLTVNIADLQRIQKMKVEQAKLRKQAIMLEQAPKETSAQSDRVLRAGDDPDARLAALVEDMEEIGVILGTLKDQRQHGGIVIPFRAAG